jgi:hypothetical protein
MPLRQSQDSRNSFYCRGVPKRETQPVLTRQRTWQRRTARWWGLMHTLRSEGRSKKERRGDRQAIRDPVSCPDDKDDGGRSPPYLFFVRADGLPDAAELVGMIEERFARPMKPTEEAESGDRSQKTGVGSRCGGTAQEQWHTAGEIGRGVNFGGNVCPVN